MLRIPGAVSKRAVGTGVVDWSRGHAAGGPAAYTLGRWLARGRGGEVIRSTVRGLKGREKPGRGRWGLGGCLAEPELEGSPQACRRAGATRDQASGAGWDDARVELFCKPRGKSKGMHPHCSKMRERIQGQKEKSPVVSCLQARSDHPHFLSLLFRFTVSGTLAVRLCHPGPSWSTSVPWVVSPALDPLPEEIVPLGGSSYRNRRSVNVPRMKE